MNLLVKSINELIGAAVKLVAFADTDKIFLFYGDMGAGKTTFIQSLCECLGTREPVTSPTFSIVNEYIGEKKRYTISTFIALKMRLRHWIWDTKSIFIQASTVLLSGPKR